MDNTVKIILTAIEYDGRGMEIERYGLRRLINKDVMEPHVESRRYLKHILSIDCSRLIDTLLDQDHAPTYLYPNNEDADLE